jgi:acetoin utilization protein AcuB
MPHETTVREIMTLNVFSVDVTDTVKKADEIMRAEKIKHIPVLEGGKIIGVITDRKLREYTLRQIYEFDNGYEEIGYNKIIDYESIMEPVSHVAYPEDSVRKAVKLFAKYRLDCLPVVDWEMKLVGILTHTDVMLFINRKLDEEVPA